jgi:hypothetical protein
MTTRTKIDEKLEGANNFRAWRYRVSLLLEERDLEKFQNQREMRLKQSTRRIWSKKK